MVHIMINKFLNIVNKGENSWWRYIFTIFLTWGISNLLGGIILAIGLMGYFVLTGNLDIIAIIELMERFDSNIIFFFISTFVIISISFIFLFISMKYIHKREFMSIVNISGKYDEFSGQVINWFNRIRWKKVLNGTLIWSIYLIVMLAIYYIMDPSAMYFNINIDNLLLIIILFFISIPIQVTFEELFFRGYLNQGIALKIKSPIIVILISSLIFSLGHVANGGFDWIFMVSNVVFSFIIGVIFSIATLVDNGIEFAVGAHFANNFFAFLIFSPDENIGNVGTFISSTISDPQMELIISVLSLLILGLILFLYKKQEVIRSLKSDDF